MGALVGLGVGVGLLLIWSAFALPRRPRSTTPTSTALGRLLGRAGLADVTPASVLSLCAVLFAVAFALVQAVSRTVPVAVVFAAMAAYLPIAVLRQRAARRLRDFAEVWPEAVDNLASAVRAGLSLPDAVAALGTNGPEALRADFAQFALDYQVTGRFGECLDRLKDRLADPVGDRVIEGLRLAREVGGGDLGRLLRNLSGFLRDDARTRSELESRQAWTVNGARLGRRRAVDRPAADVVPDHGDPAVRLAGWRPRAGHRVRRLRARLLGDDAHRPAADREADPVVSTTVWGALLGGVAGAGPAPRRPADRGAAPAAALGPRAALPARRAAPRRGHGCCDR